MPLYTRALAAVTISAALAAPASATLFLNAGPQIATHAGNLVINPSFETGAPAPGSSVYWATGTTNTPFAVPAGWTSSGAPQTYATWGSDGPGAGKSLSATIPDGNAALYFGNLTATSDVAATFNSDGTVTWAGSPTFTMDFGQPCTLSQTVNTHLSLAPSYVLNFWVSGEDAAVPANWVEGVFGLRITNVLAGDPIQYLTVPSDLAAIGTQIRYEYFFTPINPLAPVTIEFINWGHMKWPGQVGFASELVLDDIIINAIPAPSAPPLLLAAMATMSRRRRR